MPRVLKNTAPLTFEAARSIARAALAAGLLQPPLGPPLNVATALSAKSKQRLRAVRAHYEAMTPPVGKEGWEHFMQQQGGGDLSWSTLPASVREQINQEQT